MKVDHVRHLAKLQGARCDMCPLAKSESPAVPPKPNSNPLRLVLVGEEPGMVEEKLQAPFMGRSGQLLDSLLAANKIVRSSVYVTNAALCRGETDKEKEVANKCCQPRLMFELKGLKGEGVAPAPPPIITLGKMALESVLGVKEIFLSRGFVWTAPEVETTAAIMAAKRAIGHTRENETALKRDTLVGRSFLAGRVVFPTLHPAFILRSETWMPILKADFKRVGRYLSGAPFPLADVGEHEVTTDIKSLYRLGRGISLDIETTKTGSALTAKLLCVGVSDGALTKVVWPWKRELAKPFSQFLASRKEVVGHNLWFFDKVVLSRYGVD